MTVLVESLAVTNRDLFPKLQLTHCISEGSDIDIPVTTSGIASQAGNQSVGCSIRRTRVEKAIK